MGAEIKSETINYEGKTALLVSVKNGEAAIGTCCAGYTGMGGAGALTKIFFIGSEPVVTFACPNHGNKQSNKLISLAPAFKGYEQKLYAAITSSFNKLVGGEPLLNSLREIFLLLQDGVYAVYISDYYPTDGNGVFFWGGYNIPHEVHGTAEYNRLIGPRMFKPCFLVPSQPLDYFTMKAKVAADESVKRREIQGIAYHLAGFHSVLLKGHHGAVACVDNDVPFRCAVIEKICEPYMEAFVPVPPPPARAAETAENGEAGGEGAAQTEAPAPAPAPVPVFTQEGVTGFRSPSIKLPIETFPKEMMRLILEGRPEYKPRQFSMIAAKLGNGRKKTVSNNVLPYSVLEKSDHMPDCEMVESAYAISELSDQQLNCLLAGDVECNGEVIVSPNFYSSIVTACNYLQFKDAKRFVDFTIAIMDNPELAATHEYVSHRALSQGSNKKLHKFFTDALASGEAKYEKILPAAQTFVDRFKAKT